ncbi:MAG: cation diffusion facilitator family transporter [Candidatus Bathyarchaeia archaeon]
MKNQLMKLKTLKISLIAIFSVFLLEFTVGIVVRSLAILSDGAHALFDVIATLILFLAVKSSMKPPDEEHMYGHEKIETLGGLIGGLLLMATALFLMVESILRIFTGTIQIVKELELAGFTIILYTFAIDILRIKVLHGVEGDSTTIKAGFYHALADFGSTLIALVGFSLAVSGFPMFDALASLILCSALLYLSARLVWVSGMELSDAAPKGLVEKIKNEIASTKGISKVTQLKVRKAGSKTFVESTVLAPDYLSFEESHAITSEIEDKLKRCIGDAEVMVHIEPCREKSLTKLVEEIATKVEGVREVHEVNVVQANGKVCVTLHASVDPKTTVKEAHKLAEEIEKKLTDEMENIGNIAVHIEPYDERVKRGPIVNDEEIQQVIKKAVENLKLPVNVNCIATYVVHGKRYINVECNLAGYVSIREAHEIASKIEEYVRQRFEETIVNVHLEPESEDVKKG